MTISKKQLEEARKESYLFGRSHGVTVGEEKAKKDLLLVRQSGIVEICKAASELAMANAKLTYAMSRITDKLL